MFESPNAKQPAAGSGKALWAQAHGALTHGRWSEARRLLEALALSDNRDLLPPYSAYDRGHAGERAMFAQLLQDRIDAVNSAAERGAL